MHSYTNVFNIQPMKDDYLSWVHLISIVLFNNKIFRLARIFTLVFYLIFIFINIYFFITIFDATFLCQYMATFLALFSAVIFHACTLWSEKSFEMIEQVMRPTFWASTSTLRRTEQQIKLGSKSIANVVVLNVFLGIFCGVVVLPVGVEQDYQFPLFFIRKYCSQYHYIFHFVYFLTFPITSYTMVNMSNLMCYYIFHFKYQSWMCLDLLTHISAGYDDQDDDLLLFSARYQETVRQRLVFLIKRHNQILKFVKMGNEIATWLLPCLSVGGIIMGLSTMSYFFLVDTDFGYWQYFQNFTWAASAGLGMAVIVNCGQEMEDQVFQSGIILTVAGELRWFTFNKNNKQILLILITANQIPVKFKFTNTISLNYKLGIGMMKYLYSFAAVFAKLKRLY